jgi:hypothetical protein
VTASAAATPYCEITWGSTPRHVNPMSNAELVDLRTGRHGCFDRLVLDVENGDIGGYFVNYVDEVAFDGSGTPVPLRGGAKLQVIPKVPVPLAGPRFATDSELADVAGYRTFRQVAWAGSFEGQTTIGLGVRARLPFRVFVLDGPGSGSRMVVDVAHLW